MLRPNFKPVAEAAWGTGGTHARRTNTRGAYYYSCSSHGGFVIDGRILSVKQRAELDQYVTPEIGTLFTLNGKINAFHHSLKTRRTKYNAAAQREDFPIYLLEEDCEWCLAPILLGITEDKKTAPNLEEYMDAAAKTFQDWYDPASPKVQHRCKVSEARATGDPDLIISATRVDENHTRVITASKETYIVSNYSQARDGFGTPWLSRCTDPQIQI